MRSARPERPAGDLTAGSHPSGSLSSGSFLGESAHPSSDQLVVLLLRLRWAVAVLHEPLALLWLVLAALLRLNAWGVVYILAVGGLRFRPKDTRVRWASAALVLLSSVLFQYLSLLSLMPPSVWPAPDRRPWVGWGSSLPTANGTCQRLGSDSPATFGTAGFVCWLGVDGR